MTAIKEDFNNSPNTVAYSSSHRSNIAKKQMMFTPMSNKAYQSNIKRNNSIPPLKLQLEVAHSIPTSPIMLLSPELSHPTILRAVCGPGFIVDDEIISSPCSASSSCSTSPAVTPNSSPRLSALSSPFHLSIPMEHQRVKVLYSSSGSRYELGRVLKQTTYGGIIHSTLLTPVSRQQDRFRRTSLSYAIKIFSKELIAKFSESGRSQENPLKELAILQFLDQSLPTNQHLIGHVESCADDQNIYLVMPFHPGVELFDQLVAQGHGFSEMDAKTIFRQLIQTINELKVKHIAHLDISLENTLYCETYQTITLIDFGMAEQLRPSVDSNGVERFFIENKCTGKKSYISPEIVQGQRLIDATASEIWASGISLLYMLLGFPPLELAAPCDIRYQLITQGRLKDLLLHWKISLSSSAVDLIQRMLQPNPEKRISMEEILTHPWLSESNESVDESKR